MRLFDHLKPFAISLSAFLAMTGGAAASETSYYSGKPWEIVLHVPDAQNERPYCAFRTSLWETKSISIEKMIVAGDEMATALRVRKESWHLPDNQTTTVGAYTLIGMAEIPMKSIGKQELYSDVPAVPVLQYNIVIGAMLDSVLAARQPQPLTIKFSGDEPLWTVPELDRFQAFEMNDAFKRCGLDLRGLHSKTEQDDSSQEVTSPFGAASSAGQPPAQPSAAGDARPSTGQTAWEFSTAEEDWGETCFAETKVGNVKVGFMGSPGKDLAGFVEGAFTGETRATWTIDNAASYVSDGKQDDYFGWHSFYQFTDQILSDVSSGHQLTITDLDGKRLAIDLKEATEAISSFKKCFAKVKMSSEPLPHKTASKPGEPKCFLEIDHRTLIDGACKWETSSPADVGSNLPGSTYRFMSANGYTVNLYDEGKDRASAIWNQIRFAGHMNGELGELSKSGDCWVNQRVRMCVLE
ncbi:hypothetical protein [Rhizobium laguerreae]|uniref:hypothetical protein n=1 Tax=Rhizobium laguerreae TaxID=1076926 RepID=UPI001C9082BD|nr:hypothetical protein [Rhizobium laguerreae]MBY3486101.1 hypothetical protein [Rhizobium laguerreae]